MTATPSMKHSKEGQDDDRKEKPIRVYADGIYDLFHYGHARSLEQAKKLWVDEVIPDAPWVITQDFLDKHQIDYVAHDSLPYADTSGTRKDVYEYVKSIGKFKEIKRTDGISTSDILLRILKDYNEYVMRNLDRGYTRKKLGLSYVKEKRLRVNMGLKKLREKVKKQQEKVGEKIHTVAETASARRNLWVENVDRLVAGFLEMFEEGCHKMGTIIKDGIQGQLGQPLKGIVYDYEEDLEDDDEEEINEYDESTKEDEENEVK